VGRGLAIPVLFGVWAGLSGCGSDKSVSRDEALAALRQLPYEVRYRAVPTPKGLDAVIAGRARDRSGASVDFAIVLGSGGGGDIAASRQLPVVPYMGTGSGSSLGNALVITNNIDPYPEPAAVTTRRNAIGNRIEEAIFAKEPGLPHEG
jgi:hypothetical protein